MYKELGGGMMSELNELQKRLAETTDGMVVADAGPGTGKTTTIVQRYVNILNRNVDPNDILMLTFTKNSAQEMKDRVSAEIYRRGVGGDPESSKRIVRNLRAMTFDALCLNIVLNSPESVNDFFGFKETLSRGASMEENETLNLQNFRNFYADFALQRAEKYARNGYDPAALIGDDYKGLYNLLCKLMSRGIIPLNGEWFSNGEETVMGDIDKVENAVLDCDPKKLREMIDSSDYLLPDIGGWDGGSIPENIAKDAADENRFWLLEYIRDVYYHYLRHCVSENRLTFGVAELMAFAILYSDERARDMYSVRYMMVDEFQDTNELQMKICLMLLKEPNLCVVGDWKQGIYGFRFVSKENITQFESRAKRFIRELNSDGRKVDLGDIKAIPIELKDNYRSSKLILDNSFRSLTIEATKEDVVSNDSVVMLDAKMGSYHDHTAFDMIRCDEKEQEAEIVVERILDYMSGPYKVMEDDKERDMRYSDIAVLCRNGWLCEQVLNACKRRGVPAFFQGDIEIMSTREGKIALAWLRFVNNENDLRGPVSILADMGYSMADIRSMLNYGKPDEPPSPKYLPAEIKEQRHRLMRKRRRPNDLMTSIFSFYRMDNDVTQSIINIVSSAYSGSLLTIPDLIRLIEEDIESKTKYDIEPSLNTAAVTIQTMHKSKGLEYPAVIVAGVNTASLPSTKGEESSLIFNDTVGIRCKNEYSLKEIDGVKKECIFDSWRYRLISSSFPRDYSEERRILFVAMTRAKQYLTMSAYNPSRFYAEYGEGETVVITDRRGDTDKPGLAERPVIGRYDHKRISLSAHDLMSTLPEPLRNEDDVKGKGPDYGERVHNAAYQYANGMRYDETLPEMEMVKQIHKGLKGAMISTELNCILPVKNVSVKGIIDLIAEFDDHVEIHDYKTDAVTNYLEHYRLQLSVYALAAQCLNKPIRCFVDYLSLNEQKEVIPYPIERIEQAVSDYFRILAQEQ